MLMKDTYYWIVFIMGYTILPLSLLFTAAFVALQHLVSVLLVRLH